MSPPTPPGPSTTYPIASLERRFYAFALDRLLAATVVGAAGALAWVATDGALWPTAGAAAGSAVVLWLLLAVVLGLTGSSPGKRVAGLRVVHHGSGTPVGTGRALLRALVLAVCGVPTFGIGLATLAWTAVEDRGRQRRGHHDRVAQSVVVDVRTVAESEADVEEQRPRHIVNFTAMRLVPGPPVDAPPVPPRTHTQEQSVRRQPLPQYLQPASAPPAAAPGPTQVPATSPPPQPPSAPYAPPGPAPSRAPAGAPRHASRPPARWRVTFDDGESFVVTGLVLVGRRPEPRAGEVVTRLVPLSSADMSVSKTHAQFSPAPDGAIVVMDRGSTNGTVVVRKGMNRHLAPGRPTTLIDGDRVVFGDREMRLARDA